MLASQVLLPFYAVGSALVLSQLLDGHRVLRGLAVTWLVAAPLWSFYFMLTHPRSVLDRRDVAATNAYLAANDDNDFLMSSALSDGHIQASFRRHSWPALDDIDASNAPKEMMRIFEITGADHIHEVAFTGPDSRFIDKSLWQLAMPRGLWAMTGWPYLYRRKTNAVISEYDRRVLANLEAVKATKKLQLKNYAVYRIDRATTMALLADVVPAVHRIDFASVNSSRHQLSGWGAPRVVDDAAIASTIWEMDRCPKQRCRTILTKTGVRIPELENRAMGELMVRTDAACDLRMTFTFAKPSYVRFSIRGFATESLIGQSVAFTVPAKHLTGGVDIVEIENMMPRILNTPLHLLSVDLAQVCAAP
jgi:hypothetical protein